MLLILFFTSIQVLLFCREAAATASFTSTPSNPSFVEEQKDITLVWAYTLTQGISSSQFDNVTGGGTPVVIAQWSSGGTTVNPIFNGQFEADISITQARLKIIAAKRSDEGKYKFVLATTNFGGRLDHEVEVIVQSPANFTNVSSYNQTVREGLDLQLFCEASGKPDPNITWTKISQSGSESGILKRGRSWDFENINRTDAGTYHCKASNGVGIQVTHAIRVTVLFPPKIKLPNKYFVGRGKSVSLHCQVEGYPQPTITWTPCIPQGNVCGNSRLNISKVQTDADLKCTVINTLDNASENTSLIIGAKKINLTLTITSEEIECAKGASSVWEDLQEAVKNIFANKNDYVGAKLLDTRCGSLIVDLALEFGSVVSEAWVISTLRSGITDGKLGGFTVNASSIVGIPVIESTATPPTGKTTTKPSKGYTKYLHTATPPTGKTTTKPSKDTNIALIVGCVVGGSIALVIIIVVVIWCVRKNSNKDKDKRKSKTSNKVSDNDTEGHRMAQFQGGHPTPGYDNSEYENTGSTSRPPAANAGKKDKKRKKKRDEPEKPVGEVYAQVDKAKRTSKPKEPENLYDQAVRPNSKGPGELQYAAPEDLHQGHSMPRNFAAQHKKPEAYTETQYAVLV